MPSHSGLARKVPSAGSVPAAAGAAAAAVVAGAASVLAAAGASDSPAACSTTDAAQAGAEEVTTGTAGCPGICISWTYCRWPGWRPAICMPGGTWIACIWTGCCIIIPPCPVCTTGTCMIIPPCEICTVWYCPDAVCICTVCIPTGACTTRPAASVPVGAASELATTASAVTPSAAVGAIVRVGAVEAAPAWRRSMPSDAAAICAASFAARSFSSCCECTSWARVSCRCALRMAE
mmetsp:Transcript_29306/g.73169  ORF Transcript_29306/g.73169 Transcript_29306/m.73169 type:complete len:235 (+) Transcript_29306:172-876(+)